MKKYSWRCRSLCTCFKYQYAVTGWHWRSFPQGMDRVCLCSLICGVCAVDITRQLWLGCQPPTCGRLCAQRNFTVLWKESWNVLPRFGKAHFNPSLWQSDEVLSACLGPLVLLLFFHWHHSSTFPTTSPSLLCSITDHREKERETRLQELRQQREAQKGRTGVGAGEVVMRKVEKSADGSTLSQVTKTNRFAQSGTSFTSLKSLIKPVLTLNKLAWIHIFNIQPNGSSQRMTTKFAEHLSSYSSSPPQNH